MKLVARGGIIACAIIVSLSIPIVAAGAQVFKWEDKGGTVNYSDNPDTSKKNPKVEVIRTRPQELLYTEFDPTPAEPAPTPLSQEATRQQEITKSGVEVVNFEISPSVAGTAVVGATIKNNMPYPAAGLRMDIIFYTNDRKKLPDIEIPYKEGRIRPDWLGPGETATLEYLTDINQNDIAGYNYQVVFASISPTEEKEGPGITELVVNQKEGTSRVVPKEKPKEENSGAM